MNHSIDAIVPGPTHTPGGDEFVNPLSGGKPFAEFEKEFVKIARPTSPLKRFITIEEAASLVAYVCSPLAAATGGAALRMDGALLRHSSDRIAPPNLEPPTARFGPTHRRGFGRSPAR